MEKWVLALTNENDRVLDFRLAMIGAGAERILLAFFPSASRGG
jgi:hypothetical protein